MKLNIQCSSLIYRAKRVMITSKISDEILIASYDACHPKWSRKQIRCAIRTEHGRKVTFLGISSSCRSRGDPNLSWQWKKGLGNSIKSSVQGDPEKTATKYLINVSILRIAKRALEKQLKESIPLEVTTACLQKRNLRTHLKMLK